MNLDDLKHFLEIEQGLSDITRDEALDIVKECEPSSQLREKEMLGSVNIESIEIGIKTQKLHIHTTIASPVS